MTNQLQATQSLGQSIWYDNVQRGLLTSGEMQRLIQWGVSGVTSNPTIFEKAISLEVSPTLAHDTEATNAEARRLFATLDRPNLMIKVPATPEGILAVRRLIGQGINVNVTLIFSLKAHRQVMEAYIDGLEELARSGGDVSKVASVRPSSSAG